MDGATGCCRRCRPYNDGNETMHRLAFLVMRLACVRMACVRLASAYGVCASGVRAYGVRRPRLAFVRLASVRMASVRPVSVRMASACVWRPCVHASEVRRIVCAYCRCDEGQDAAHFFILVG